MQLSVLKLAQNQLCVLHDIEHLLTLGKLSSLSLHDNPMVDQPHSRVCASRFPEAAA
jgi:hypothetical protein